MAEKKKLGDYLLDAGLISRLQIDQALQAQQIFGGRIGTNLIEMEAIDDETLVAFLSQQLGVPRAKRAEMENIPEEIVALIPIRVAQRFSILPLRKEDETVVVAVMDLMEDRIRERLETNIHFKIRLSVATELELRYFLEKYYGIPREMRHIHLMQSILNKDKKQKSPVGDIDALTTHLDKTNTLSEAIHYFFQTVGTLDAVPLRNADDDITQYDLTPELAFLLMQVDGLSSLKDLLSYLPLRRVISLRAFMHLTQLGLIRYEKTEEKK